MAVANVNMNRPRGEKMDLFALPIADPQVQTVCRISKQKKSMIQSRAQQLQPAATLTQQQLINASAYCIISWSWS